MATVEANPSLSRILVVEDDEMVAAVERRSLEGHGFAVDVTHRVATAMARLGSEAYDAVVLDYQLPDGPCWPVLAVATECVPPIPVIIVTGVGDEQAAAMATRCGAADYVIKSARFSAELPTAVERAVRIAASRQLAVQTEALATARLELASELQLREGLERRYRTLFEQAATATLIFAADGQLVEVNHSGELLFAAARLQLIGREISDFTDNGRGQELANCIRAVAATGAAQVVLAELSRNNGEVFHAEYSLSRIDIDGEVFVQAMAKEVTAAAASAHELTLSESGYESLLAHIPDMVWRTNSDGATLFISQAVERIAGFSPAEVYASGLSIWPGRIHADEAVVVMTGLAQLAEGLAFDAKFRLQHKAGHYIWLHARAVRVQAADGSYDAVGQTTEIAKQKRNH